MPALPLIIAPNPIFRKKALAVEAVNDEIRQLVSDMFLTLYAENGAGIGANMVGVLKQVIVIDLKEGGNNMPLAMINPKILEISDQTQIFTEASLSFPGIEADITRPAEISVHYLDEAGENRKQSAKGFLAAVIQHEMDYLEGRIFLDHLSRIKRESLLRKYKKIRRRETSASNN